MAGKEVEIVVHRATLDRRVVAYVAVQFGGKEEKTKESERTGEPTWEETFRFLVKDEHLQDPIRIIVYKKGGRQIPLLNRDLPLGSQELGWCEVLLSSLPRNHSSAFSKNLIVGAMESDANVLHVTCKASGFGRGSVSAPLVGPLPLGPALAAVVPFLEKLQPVFLQLNAAVEVADPFLNKAWDGIQMAWYHYNLEALAPAMLGLAMVFLGGTYMTTIAAVEAYRLCGWQSTQKSLRLLYGEMKQAHLIVSQLDDVDDADAVKPNNAHKLERIMEALDPIALEQGITGLYQGTLAVIATLRTRFAHAVTLGASLAGMAAQIVSPTLSAALKKALPERHHKWVPLIVKYIITSFTCSLAWSLLRIFSAFHSAMYGAQLLAQGVIAYFVKQKKITPDRAAALNYSLVMWAVGCAGFLWQCNMGFRLPFPLNLLLFPLSLVESFLMLLVNWDNSWI